MTTEITNILNGFKEFSENPYKDAIKFLKEYIEVEESDEAFFELGKALFFNEDYDESIEFLEKCTLSKANAYLGLDYYKKEDFKMAINCFEEFLKENQNETVSNYMMLSYEKENDFANAIRIAEGLLEANPKNTSIIIHLIDHHFNLRQYKRCMDCIDMYGKSLSFLDKYDPKVKFKKGLALFNLKRYDEVISQFRNIKTPEAYHLISRSYEMLGKPSKAIRYLMKSYELDKNINTLFEVVDLHFKHKSWQSAIYILLDILETDSSNERALERISKAYMEIQDEYYAVKYCEELLNVNDKNVKAYLTLSNVHYIFGDSEKALETIERGLAIDPSCSELWALKAWVYYPTDFEEFIRLFEKALKLEPNNLENYMTLIDSCLWEDRMESARKNYERMVFYNPAFSKSFDEILNEHRSGRL